MPNQRPELRKNLIQGLFRLWGVKEKYKPSFLSNSVKIKNKG